MIEIIPAIDLIGGRCVRLSQGDFSQKTVYTADPVEIAKQFEESGLQRLHLVDLDGARSGAIANLKILESISRQTNLKIDFGGGIKTAEDISSVFNAGAAIAAVGSIAVRRPDMFFEWLGVFGNEKILLGADVRDGKVAVDGWQTKTEIDVFTFLEEYFSRGVRESFVTDISVDGLLSGPSVALYRQMIDRLPRMKIIASGGVSRVGDIDELEKVGCSGVIIGKAIYEGKVTLKELADRAVRSLKQAN